MATKRPRPKLVKKETVNKSDADKAVAYKNKKGTFYLQGGKLLDDEKNPMFKTSTVKEHADGELVEIEKKIRISAKDIAFTGGPLERVK